METVKTILKARKTHQCEVCGWHIEPGTNYERVVTFDGDVSVWKSHSTPCAIAADRAYLAGYEDGGLISTDQVAEWASEYADHDEIACELHRRLVINTEQARQKATITRTLGQQP